MTTVTTGAKREDKKRPVIIPYIRGFSEELKTTFGGYGIPTYFNPKNGAECCCWSTKKIQWGRTKLWAQCTKLAVRNVREATYVEETERSLNARFGEHRRPSSTTSEVSKHIHTYGQPQPHQHVGEHEDTVCGAQMVQKSNEGGITHPSLQTFTC